MYNIESTLAKIEQNTNPLDWVPLVSCLTGTARIAFGVAEVAAGVAYAALKIFSIILTGEGYYDKALKQGAWYIAHGLGNITRGLIAAHPGVNLILFIYDNYIGRMNYEGEKINLYYPLLTAYRSS